MAQALKDILDTIIQPEQSWKLQLLKQWETIFGKVKTRVQLLRISDDTLILGVADSCWMQELYLLTPLLLTTINNHLGQPIIKNLRFKAVGNTPKSKSRLYKRPSYTPTPENIILTKKEEQALSQLNDPALAQVLRTYLLKIRQK